MYFTKISNLLTDCQDYKHTRDQFMFPIYVFWHAKSEEIIIKVRNSHLKSTSKTLTYRADVQGDPGFRPF